MPYLQSQLTPPYHCPNCNAWFMPNPLAQGGPYCVKKHLPGDCCHLGEQVMALQPAERKPGCLTYAEMERGDPRPAELTDLTSVYVGPMLR